MNEAPNMDWKETRFPRVALSLCILSWCAQFDVKTACQKISVYKNENVAAVN